MGAERCALTWRDRAGWSLGWESRRWAKSLLASVPGSIGSSLRGALYGFACVGQDVLILENVWVEYPRNVRIGSHVGIARGCQINGGGGVRIGDWCLMGPRVVIWSQNHLYSDPHVPIACQGAMNAEVSIERDVWLGAGSIVLPGVTIGESSVVAAGSVVTHDIPRDSVAAGVPAKVIGQRSKA